MIIIVLQLVNTVIIEILVESKLPRTQTTPTLDSNSRSHSLPFRAFSLDIAEDSTEDSTAALQRELEVEERIVEAARRMAELPTSNRRERQKRKQSLQLSVLLSKCILLS